MSVELSRVSLLQKRADLLKKARIFFDERYVMEVDCPALLPSASIDAHIDLISCSAFGKKYYLHTSPEYCMKRLLSEGFRDIYYLGHVYRDFECGAKHNPEFCMAEWYRRGISYDAMIQETCDFISLFVGTHPIEKKGYREYFLTHTGCDPYTASENALLTWLEDQGVSYSYNAEVETKDDILSFIFTTFVEPHLGKGVFSVVANFPRNQAALAQHRLEGDFVVAERFEVFYDTLELANGFHELQDAAEQRVRFIEANWQRKKMGKEELPIDKAFLEALERGVPDTCGVAVGFDRCVMLHVGASSLDDVLFFSWQRC